MLSCRSLRKNGLPRLVNGAVLQVAPENPLISLPIAVNILAGITGSASDSMSIALQTLSPGYLELARIGKISPELLHRVTVTATGGLYALLHNGAVITLLSICKLSQRDAYLDILVVALIGPIAALVAVFMLGTWLVAF
jgi:H+/gluconate symporter-like permease